MHLQKNDINQEQKLQNIFKQLAFNLYIYIKTLIRYINKNLHLQTLKMGASYNDVNRWNMCSSVPVFDSPGPWRWIFQHLAASLRKVFLIWFSASPPPSLFPSLSVLLKVFSKCCLESRVCICSPCMDAVVRGTTDAFWKLIVAGCVTFEVDCLRQATRTLENVCHWSHFTFILPLYFAKELWSFWYPNGADLLRCGIRFRSKNYVSTILAE